MRKLSDKTWELLSRLQTRPSVWDRLARRTRSVEGPLADIGNSGETGAIPFMVPFLLASSPPVAVAAANAIHQLLARTSRQDLVWLDEQIRSWPLWQETPWARLEFQTVQKLIDSGDPGRSVLGLLSFHANGHLRQEAVRQLGQSYDPAALPFLLIRLNDWVPEVRNSAYQTVERWLVEGPFEAFLTNLYLVARLINCERADFSNIIESVARKLLEPGYLDVLLRVIAGNDRLVARRWFTAALSHPGTHASRLFEAAISSRDVVLRLKAAGSAPRVFAGNELLRVLTSLRSDAYPAVRSIAISEQLNRFPESTMSVLEESLLDRAASVREHARYHLRKINSAYDFPGFYRKAILDNRHFVVALHGLGETGVSQDVPLIVPYLNSQTVGVRIAATQALSRLADDEHLPRFLDFLRDDNAKIVGLASKWLSSRLPPADLHSIATLFATDTRRHVRRAALSLLDSADTWEALPYLIAAAQDADEQLQRRAWAVIERRYNRVFTRPTDRQVERIRDALRRSKVAVDQRSYSELKEWLVGLGTRVE